MKPILLRCLAALLVWVGSGLSGWASAPLEVGYPFIRNYSPREYGAESQNWAVLQDSRGIVHVGNNRGVLAYDGVRWRLIPTQNRTVVRSLGMDEKGRVYVGAVGEIGYLAPDAHGVDAFISMTEKLPVEVRGFGDVWATVAIPGGMLFQTRKHLFLLQDERIQIVNADTTFHVAFVTRGRIFVRQREVGLEELKNGRLALVPGGERFARESVFAMLPLGPDPNAILVGTREAGLWRLDASGLRRFQTPADGYLKDMALYSGARLADGTLALATIKGGVVLLDADGKVQGRLDRLTGLQSDNVKALCPDRDSAIWLALDNGISRVEWPSPLTAFDERSGLKGTVWAIQRYRDRLYVATGQGAYVMEPSGGSDPRPRFRALAGISTQSLSFLPLEDQLLLGSAQGVFAIQGDKAKPIRRSSNVAITFLRSRMDPRTVFLGMQGGLVMLRYLPSTKTWREAGRVPGVEDDVYSMAEDDQGRLWLGTSSQGAVRITFPPGGIAGGGEASPRIEPFGTDRGLPSAMQPFLFGWEGGILAATQAGVMRFDEARGRFEVEHRFAALFPEGPRAIKAVRVEDSGRVWMDTLDLAHGTHETGVAVPGANGALTWESAPFRRFSESSIEVIQVDPSGVVWFGGPSGVLRFDPAGARTSTRPYAALIRRVTAGEALLFGGDGPVPEGAGGPVLPFKRRALRFEFASPHFDVASASEYQTWLEGYDRAWSPWSSEPQKEFTNLPEGTYRFKVRARDVYGQVSQEQSFPFRILPPWYRTGWAMALFLVLLLLLAAAGARGWTRFLLVRNRTLQKKIDLATEELRERERLLAAQAGALEHMNVQLRDLNEQKNQFLAIVAHDLRNPLTSILLSSQLIEEEEELPEIHRRAGMILREGAEMEALIGAFLELSVLESGDIKTEISHVPIPGLLERLIQRHEPRAKEKGIRIEGPGEPGDWAIVADEKFVTAVLDNLISNAIKFSPPGTSVAIQVEGAGRWIRITVQDEGPGLTEADQKKVFGRFSRLSARPTGGEKSVGLGLSIAKQMVEACGGRIWVESEAGKGAKFLVEFPRSVA